MKPNSPTSLLKLLILLAAGLSAIAVQARPYASGITNDGVNISFVLNEDADNVKVIFDGGGPGNTNELNGGAAVTRGLQSVPLGAHTTFAIHVSKAAGPGYTTGAPNQIVPDQVLMQFNSPRGLAVNNNPASTNFGRIYVANSASGATGGRSLGKGIYMLNADFSDALGLGDTASTAGLPLNASANSPYRISLGEDGRLYITDFSDANGNLFSADGDVSAASGMTVLQALTGTAVTPVTTANTHGSLIATVVTGSSGAGNLTVYTLDEDLQPDRTSVTRTNVNSLWRYPINGDALPFTGFDPSYKIFQPQVATVAQTMDLERGPDGKFYVYQLRDPGQTTPSLYILDSNGSVITNSRQLSLAISGVTSDLLSVQSSGQGHIAVSPDGNYLALVANNNRVFIVPLLNGMPQLSNPVTFFTAIGTTVSARDVAFDAAGNVYVASSGLGMVRAFGPGGTATTITKSDGTFQIVIPPNTVTVTNSIPTATEGGATGRFTITRSGGTTANALTVNYSVSGDAVSGTDFTVLAGTVTLKPGDSSTNITVTALDDPDVEFTETVTVSLIPDVNYAVGPVGGAASVQILDADTPEITISGETGAQTNLLESFADSQVILPLTRKGLLASAITVNLSYSGVAVRNSDYTNAPLTITFAPGAVTTNLILRPLNDVLVEAPEAFTVTIEPGSYNPGATIAASGLVYSEDLSSANLTTIFADQFDTDTAANWQVNQSDGDSHAYFGTNYGSAFGVPEAPSSSGSATPTRGLILRAHLSSTNNAPGISVSPLNLTGAKGDFRLRFDMWMNYNGPLAAGGTGSTEHFSAGIGVSGTTTTWPGGAGAEGIWVTAASDGDVTDTITGQADYGVFVSSALQSVANGWYAAGITSDARGNGNVHYAPFGRSTAPAAQTNLFPNQTESVRVGALGMAWHAVTLAKQGDSVTWDVDGYRIATIGVTASGATLTSGNVFLGFHDWFNGACGDPRVNFALYDNVRVEVAQPVITDVRFINAGTELQITFTASITDINTSFDIQASGNVATGYADLTATVNPTANPGEFQAVLPLLPPNSRPPTQFYRVRRL